MGNKRRIAVDPQELPHAVAITAAEVTDRKGMQQALTRRKPGLGQVPRRLADRG